METELITDSVEVPLIGLKPGIEVARDRITDLLIAIWHNMKCNELTHEQMSDLKMFSIELSEQLDLMDTLTIYQ